LLAVATLLAGFAVPNTAQGAVYVYESSTGNGDTIPVAGTDARCDAGIEALSVTFEVPDSFSVTSVAVGINASHSDRDQIRATLVSPLGASTLVVLTQGGGGTLANYDIMIAPTPDPSGTAQSDGDGDPVAEPYFHRLVTRNTLATEFDGDQASGTWTLRVCDRVSGTSGTLNRARLVLEDAAVATQVCTGTLLTYEWGSNGNGNLFPVYPAGPSIGGVTMGLITSLATPPGSNPTGQNFRTQTGQIGAEFGYFFNNFNDSNFPSNNENIRYLTSWGFSVPVRDLQWKVMDADRSTPNDWEDLVRLDGRYGTRVSPWVPALGADQQRAGDFIEADDENYDTDEAGANFTYRFNGPVSVLNIEYWAGDDFVPSENQYIGFGNPFFCAFDFGDAPNSYGTMLGNGARHVLGERLVHLGANAPDGESDGQTGGGIATADDQAAVGVINDEDGTDLLDERRGRERQRRQRVPGRVFRLEPGR